MIGGWSGDVHLRGHGFGLPDGSQSLRYPHRGFGGPRWLPRRRRMLVHLRMGDVDHEALMNWLAAAPIVVFGAPIGAWLASRLPRVKVLYFVSGLCVFQFLWTLQQTAHAPAEWIFVTAAMSIGLALLATHFIKPANTSRNGLVCSTLLPIDGFTGAGHK